MSQLNVRIWDLPTRVFHWSLVACVVGLVITAEVGGNAMVWHFRFGYAVITLLLFRVVWGVVGGYWSRFTSFVPTPAGLIRYLRGQTGTDAGHNPLGALSVLAMLGALLCHAAFGLASDDEIAAAGPLTQKLPAAWVSLATYLHTEVSKIVLAALIFLHIGAIAWYRFRRGSNLLRPMLTGDKPLDASVPASRDDGPSRLFAVFIFALCAGSVYGGLMWVA